MDSRRFDGAFFSLPETSWDDVDSTTLGELLALRQVLETLLCSLQASLPEAVFGAESDASEPSMPDSAGSVPQPAQLAVRLYELANKLWVGAARPEQDLRQIISTLRTALAVCWDLYSPSQSEHTTVAQHIVRLRETIEDFQKDLDALQKEYHRRQNAP